MTDKETSAAYFLNFVIGGYTAEEAKIIAKTMDDKTLNEYAWLGSNHMKKAWAGLEKILTEWKWQPKVLLLPAP